MHEPSSALATAEIVHWVALAFMGLVYTIRLFWLFGHKAGRDRQRPNEAGRTTPIQGSLYSLANVAMPWAMESTRKGLLFWFSFVIFHLGVVAGISQAFLSGLFPAFVTAPVIGTIFEVLLGAAFIVAIIRMIRRIGRPVLRLVSTPDDYFSLLTLTVWFASGFLAHRYLAGKLEGEGYLIAFLYATSFFLAYVPFSKISHYLYYPFTRIWIGRTLGHRGSMPAARR